MKGILLAGGSGTRLYPITKGITKSLLNVYDKPLIYYSLSILMLANIRDILIIIKEEDLVRFQNILGNGKEFGINIEYAIQNKPNGIAESFLIGEDFIKDDDVFLMLADNVLYGNDLTGKILQGRRITEEEKKSVIFGYDVKKPSEYGIAVFDEQGNVKSINEKPKRPKSNTAIIGVYMYPNDVISFAKRNKPSARGELEITSINNMFLNQERLKLVKLKRGMVFYDTGNSDNLFKCSNFVRTIETNSKQKIACLEEIALRKRWINKKKILDKLDKLSYNSYTNYLRNLIEEE